MAGERRVIAFGQGSDDAGTEVYDSDTAEVAEATRSVEQDDAWDSGENHSPPLRAGWIVPAIAMLAITVWTAFFAFAHRAGWPAAGDPESWTRLVSDWAMPVVLVCLVWLLAMRNSRREAVRFADAARLLSDESGRLESRLEAHGRRVQSAGSQR